MIKVRLIEVEGNAEEVMRVRQLFGNAPQQVSDQMTDSEPFEASPISANSGSVTVELVLRVLTRRELHQNVKKALKLLQRAGSKGMTSEEIAKGLGIDRGQLAGVFGAFGRRIANTKGWPTGAVIIAYRRNDNGRKVYYLPSVVHEALGKLDL